MEPRRARGNVSQMMEAAGTRARARVRAQWEARVRRAITTIHRIAALAATGWPTSAAVAGCDLTAQPCVFSITCQQVGGGAPSVRRPPNKARRGELGRVPTCAPRSMRRRSTPRTPPRSSRRTCTRALRVGSSAVADINRQCVNGRGNPAPAPPPRTPGQPRANLTATYVHPKYASHQRPDPDAHRQDGYLQV